MAWASTLGWMLLGVAAAYGQVVILGDTGVNGWAIAGLLVVETAVLVAPWRLER